MGDSTQWVKHVELYVDSSATPAQQAASVDAIAVFLKNDMLTLEALVREMDMYLTTTDSFIRSRGILIIAEILVQLTTKPLSNTSLHSLIRFFTERLADWKAIRGALVGCLALLKRKTDVGMVTESEAKDVAVSYIEYLQVQALGQHDRKLSFQLMECLLDRHAGAIDDMGDSLVYGICEAIDLEKDPQCLLVVFHIVERLACLYPCPSGPVAKFAEELFEILGSYFPIHFTHPQGEDNDFQGEELSRALMRAFACTPVFEPFSVPLLLEKLSSSLPSAKVESFKYLSYCTTKYGPGRMEKHAKSIWASVKDVTYISPQSNIPVESETIGGMNFQECNIMTQAFVLLQEIIRQDAGFICLITGDNDINTFVHSLNQYENIYDTPVEVKQRLHAVGCILSICAKTSIALCNKVFDSYFPVLIDALGLTVSESSESSYIYEDGFSPVKFNFGVLYICIELLSACRSLTLSFDNIMEIPDFSHQTCWDMLRKFSESLVNALIFLSRSNIDDNEHGAYVYLGVKGLQILATFPGSFLLVSKSTYDNILSELMSIITSDSNTPYLWRLSLNALVEIGLFINKYPDSEKAASFESAVMDNIVSLISSDKSSIPTSLKLQAAFDIGATRKDFMLRVAEGLDAAISTKFSALYDHGILDPHKPTVNLLDTYSHKVLPWFIEIGGFEEIPLNFALGIWDKIEKSRSFDLSPPEIASDLLIATMNAMKKAVGSCSEQRQEIIINKAFGVLLSNNLFGPLGSESSSSILKAEGSKNTRNCSNSSCKEGWLASLFASVIIALRPQTSIPNVKMVLTLFITNLLNSHIPSAHVLGSLVNKLPLEISGLDHSRNFSLIEALDMILHCFIGIDSTSEDDGHQINFSNLGLNTHRTQSDMINTVIGLAWIGKGLIMRGHERVKEITMTLLSFLTLDRNGGLLKQLQDLVEECNEEYMHQLMKCSGDAFQIIMSDSESCLNRTYHATVRPLYKQRFFSIIMPIFLSLIIKSEPSFNRSMLYRAFAYVVSDTPPSVVLGESKKLVPLLLDCLHVLSNDIMNKEIVYDVLLVISGILVDKTGQGTAIEYAPSIINLLIALTTYSHLMAVRETALQCLVAMSELPYTRIYPLKNEVLGATSKALDDSKRIVRQEAVKCRQAWTSIS